ncbi:hypothetical protein EI94DRAFT_120722 [Lactarius quietus]|nr:hypothetical protein EI94DRAFT_120722 [Lactarius quietus]
MYTFHIAILVLAASPALSAPLAIADVVERDDSLLVFREPRPSGGDIRDLLEDFALRSEGVGTGHHERDTPAPPRHSRDGNLVQISSRELLESLKRDGLVDDIRARGFLSTLKDGLTALGSGAISAGQDVGQVVKSAVD